MMLRYSPKSRFFRVDTPPAASDAPSVLAFSMAKGGSTLLYNMLTRLAPLAGLTYFSIEDHLFASGVSPNRRPTAIGHVFEPRGFCYAGFRQFPAYPVPILHSSRVAFLIRDPRDMITSLYFSLVYSHRMPDGDKGGTGRAEMEASREALSRTEIDRFAVEAIRTYLRLFEAYVAQGFHWRPNVATYRYEDVIFRKAEWVADLCEWFGWDIPEADRLRVTQEFDELPDQERPREHVRQVSPGNHKRHLSPETQQQITAALGEYMDLFGYE
jgi:hypothetical protein